MAHAVAAQPPRARRSEIRRHSLPSALTAAGRITFGHPGAVLLPFLLITAPAATIQIYGTMFERPEYMWTGVLAGLLTGLFGYAVLVVTVSDISLGHRPSVRRSMAAVTGKNLGALGLAAVLQILISAIGLVLLVVPGILAILWLMFTQAVVVIERKPALTALKRSRELSRGYTGRHFMLLLTLFALSFALNAIAMITIGVTSVFIALPPMVVAAVFQVISVVFQTLFVVTLVLLYYDLRVRKEAYSPDQLGEDLAR